MSNIILKSLYLDNFKSFKDSKFEFGKLNCLIAPNNAGKSNLIEALEFLNTLIYENPIRAIAKIGFENIKNFHHDEKITKINAKFDIENTILVGTSFIKYENSLEVLFSLNLESNFYNLDIIVDGKLKYIDVDRLDLLNNLGYFDLKVYSPYIESFLKDYNKYLNSLNKTRFTSFKLNYNYSTDSCYIESNSTTKDVVKRLFSLDFVKNKLVSGFDLKEIFNKSSLFRSHYFHAHEIKRTQESGFNYLLHNGTNLAEYLTTLNKDILEDISTSLIGEIELINSLEIKDGFTKEIIFNEEVNGKNYPIKLQKVSDGTVHFIAIMTALIGNTHSIGMMIEEPERHMHMKTLSYILNTMRDSDKQIFFTTHSTEMLGELKLDEIIFMFRDFNGDTKGIRAKDIKNITKIMKLFKNDLVSMIQMGVVGEYDE